MDGESQRAGQAGETGWQKAPEFQYRQSPAVGRKQPWQDRLRRCLHRTGSGAALQGWNQPRLGLDWQKHGQQLEGCPAWRTKGEDTNHHPPRGWSQKRESQSLPGRDATGTRCSKESWYWVRGTTFSQGVCSKHWGQGPRGAWVNIPKLD